MLYALLTGFGLTYTDDSACSEIHSFLHSFIPNSFIPPFIPPTCDPSLCLLPRSLGTWVMLSTPFPRELRVPFCAELAFTVDSSLQCFWLPQNLFEPVWSLRSGAGVSIWYPPHCGRMFGHTDAHETLVDCFTFHVQPGLPSQDADLGSGGRTKATLMKVGSEYLPGAR